MACDHTNFKATVTVHRLQENAGGPITSYAASVVVKCVDCNLPFRFVGFPAGYHYAEARVSVDATELRVPIEPAYVTEIAGVPLISGRA